MNATYFSKATLGLIWVNDKWNRFFEFFNTWIMDFFDDPMYSNKPRKWNAVSLIMLRPETSIAVSVSFLNLISHSFKSFFNNSLTKVALLSARSMIIKLCNKFLTQLNPYLNKKI